MGKKDADKPKAIHRLDVLPLSRRRLLQAGASLAASAGMTRFATAQEPPYTDYDSVVEPFDPDPISNIRAPSLKPLRSGQIHGRWDGLANLPVPTQEIYPSAFWTSQIADRQPTKALKAQRFNIIVNAGGLAGIGRGRFNVLDQTAVYDPIVDRWASGPRLPEPKHHFHLVAHNGYLFGMGGFTTVRLGRNSIASWHMSREVLRLDSPQGRWQRLRPLPIAQSEAACVSVGGFIHLAGGRSPIGSQNALYNDHIDTDRHWVYDARQDQWFERAPMSVARNSMAAVGMRGVIYTFGGRRVSGGNLNITEAYDPLSDRWQTMRPMPRAQAGLAAASIGNTVFVFGGEYFGGPSGGGVYSEVLAYDTTEDRWRSAGLMTTPRHGLGAVSMNNAIYLIGGATQPGANGTTARVDRFLL